MDRARVWVPGRSEINMRESCNGLPSVVLSFITSSHGVEFVIRAVEAWDRGQMPAGCMGFRSHLAGQLFGTRVPIVGWIIIHLVLGGLCLEGIHTPLLTR